MVDDNDPQQQQWRMNLRAKYRSFHLHIRTTDPIPTLKLPNFSVLLRLHRFILKVEADSRSATPSHSQGRSKSRFGRIVEKFRSPRLKKQSVEVTRLIESPPCPLRQGWIGVSTLFLVLLGYLLGAISASLGQKGIIFVGTFILAALLLVVKKYTRRRCNPELIIWSSLVICLVFYLGNCCKYRNYVMQCLWKAWKFYFHL